MNSPTLELYFFALNAKLIKISKYQLNFENVLININEDYSKHILPEYIFKYNKEKSLITAKFYDKASKFLFEARWTVYKGKNYAFIQKESKGLNTEIIFRTDENLKIQKDDFIFDKLDNFNTQNRKRLTLINYNSLMININNIDYNIQDIISSNCKIKENSYQICVFSLEKNIFGVKPIYSNFNMLDFTELIIKKNIVEQLSNEFESNLKIKTNALYIKSILDLKKRIKKNISNEYIKSITNMSLPEEYLDEKFNENKLINLDTYFNLITLDYISKYSKKIMENRELIQNFLIKIKLLLKKLNSDKNLKLFEKIQILINCFRAFEGVENTTELNKLNLRYYSFSKSKKDSILYKVQQFFNDFINNLSEKSKIFPNLLYINSGYAYHNFQIIYAFDMYNINMIKDYLKQIFQKVLLFFNNKKINKIGFHCKGGIAINEYYTLEKPFHLNNINYCDKLLISESLIDNISMKIVLLLLHEFAGHKKYHSGFFGNENPESSPIKYINDEIKLIELKYYKNFDANDKNSDFILSNNTNKKGDSGHFLELSFDKIDNKNLITYHLRKLNNIEKLIKRPDLFYDEEGEILKKYTELKLESQRKNIALYIKKDMSIEDEIELMEDINHNKNYKRKREKEYEEDSKKKHLKLENREEEEDDINEEEVISSSNDNDNYLIYQDYNSEDEKNKINLNKNLYYEDILDVEKRFHIIEEYLIRKFNLNYNKGIISQIKEKMKDPNISDKDIDNFNYLLDCYEIQF